MGTTKNDDLRCPVCGVGVVSDIMFDAGSRDSDQESFQDPTSHELISYSCGHRAGGPRLSTADADTLNVERRQTEETVEPPDAE